MQNAKSVIIFNFRNKFFRCETSECRIEMLHHYTINTNVRKRSKLVTQIQNPWRSLFWRKEFLGVRLESHHATHQATLLGAVLQLFEQGAMTPVHAIEITDA